MLSVLSAKKFVFTVLSNLIKLWYVYGEHLPFVDYVGFQILGFLQRNDRMKNKYVQGKEHVFFFAFSRISLFPIILNLVSSG